MRQYEVVIVNLDPTIGREIKKTRPCVIISPDEMNEVLGTVIIAPVTSNRKKYVSRVEINRDRARGMIALDQIRTLDKSRITTELGTLLTKRQLEVETILLQMLVDSLGVLIVFPNQSTKALPVAHLDSRSHSPYTHHLALA